MLLFVMLFCFKIMSCTAEEERSELSVIETCTSVTPRRLEALLATKVASTLAMLLIKTPPRTEVVSAPLRVVSRLFRALIACFAIMADFGNDGALSSPALVSIVQMC